MGDFKQWMEAEVTPDLVFKHLRKKPNAEGIKEIIRATYQAFPGKVYGVFYDLINHPLYKQIFSTLQPEEQQEIKALLQKEEGFIYIP